MSKTILIVDDDTVCRRLIRMVLEYDGCRCMEAEDGDAALAMLKQHDIDVAMLKQHDIDVMILDYMMPKVSGIEVLTALRQPSQPLSPPTIMITGLLQPLVRKQATQLGAFAILEKPYDLGELRALIAHICITWPSSSKSALFPSPERSSASSTPRANL